MPVVPGLGITPSGRGSQSRPDPRHPAGVAPGKRPRLTPNPAMLLTEAGGVMPFGTPGGDVQIQAMLQVLLNIMHFGMDPQTAIEAPRVASYSFPSSFAPFEYFPGRLAVEGRIDQATRDELAARGHEIQRLAGLDLAGRLGGGDPDRSGDRADRGRRRPAAAGLRDRDLSLRKRSDGNRRWGRCVMPFRGAVTQGLLWPLRPIHHQVHAARERSRTRGR